MSYLKKATKLVPGDLKVSYVGIDTIEKLIIFVQKLHALQKQSSQQLQISRDFVAN